MGANQELTSSERALWVGLWETPGIGPGRFGALLSRFDTIEQILGSTHNALAEIVPGNVAAKILTITQTSADLRLAWYLDAGVEIVTICDDGYPSMLGDYDWSPQLLYIKGTLQQEDSKALAVVGTRKPTSYGRQVTRDLVGALCGKSYTIVSGLADGIDGVAHAAAIQHGGRTVAVLGTGIDVVYPSEHEQLAKGVVEHGALLTMYPAGQGLSRGQFAVRNRLVAGLSCGVLVTEAAEKSGTKITVEYGRDQGKPIFAVPGPVNGAMSEGPLSLIQEGAVMVTSAESIFGYFNEVVGVGADRDMAVLSEVQRGIVDELSRAAMTLDELSLILDQTADELMSELTMLELDGWVRRDGVQWQLG